MVLCHEASSFFANTESEKAAKITKQVSKIQLLADDDDEDMEEMFIMVCHASHMTPSPASRFFFFHVSMSRR